jgi:hypothetical protein
VCTACVGGSTNPAGDDPGGANTTCSCSTNTSVVSNVCTPCGHGGSTDAGDAVPGPDTQCIYPTCDINEHVASNVCTACVGGSTIRAGRTLLAAARQIRPSFRTYAPRAATGVPPMRAMRFQVRTPSVSILHVTSTSTWHPTCARRASEVRRSGRGEHYLRLLDKYVRRFERMHPVRPRGFRRCSRCGSRSRHPVYLFYRSRSSQSTPRGGRRGGQRVRVVGRQI